MDLSRDACWGERVFDSGANVSLANNIMNVIEAEFAFRMACDLPQRSAPYSIDEVIDAVESMHPAIEIPDSRYREFVAVGAAQLIADNACASYFVLGPATVAGGVNRTWLCTRNLPT
jgi:2-keto-4-pentenoate hydratase